MSRFSYRNFVVRNSGITHLVALELACDRIVVEETSVWIGCVIVVMVVAMGVGVGGSAAEAVPEFGVPPPWALGHIMSRMQ
jgi:hypothetical protein